MTTLNNSTTKELETLLLNNNKSIYYTQLQKFVNENHKNDNFRNSIEEIRETAENIQKPLHHMKTY